MGSAVPDVQACADYLCLSSDEEGIARALASFFLNKDSLNGFSALTQLPTLGL